MFDHKLRKHNTNNDNEYFNIEQTEIEKQHEQEDVGIHRAGKSFTVIIKR